jgi:hypothetical protein
MVWSKRRQANGLRSTLREFYPAALLAFDDLASGDALEVLRIAPTPTLGASLSRSKIAAVLRRGGRQRRVEERAVEIQAALRSEQLAAPAAVTAAMGISTVLARHVRNRRLADAVYLWAFASLSSSAGARAYYDARRAAGDGHHQALRALGNRLVGILHGCLTHHVATTNQSRGAIAPRAKSRMLLDKSGGGMSRALPSTPAASRSRSGRAWAYRLRVIVAWA